MKGGHVRKRLKKSKYGCARPRSREREGSIPLCSYLTLGATCQLNEEKGTEAREHVIKREKVRSAERLCSRQYPFLRLTQVKVRLVSPCLVVVDQLQHSCIEGYSAF